MQRKIVSVFSGNLAASLIGILGNIAVARLLTTADYGVVMYAVAGILLFATLFDFGMSTAVVVEHGRANDRTAVGAANRAFLLILGAAVLIAPLVAAMLAHSSSASFFQAAVIVATALLLASFKYITAIHQALGQWASFNVLNVVASLLRSAFLVFAALYAVQDASRHPADLTLLAYGGSVVVALLAAVVVSRGCLTYSSDESASTRIWRTASQLAVANGIIALVMRVDLFIIERHLGGEQLGIYAAANSLALAFPLLTGAIMAVYLREFAHSTGDAALSIVLRKQLKLIPYALFACIGIMLIAEPIIQLAFGSRYVESAGVFRILVIAYAGGIVFTPLEGFLYAKASGGVWRFKLLQFCSIGAAGLVFVEPFGVEGVAWAVVASRVLGWIVLVFWATKRLSSLQQLQSQVPESVR